MKRFLLYSSNFLLLLLLTLIFAPKETKAQPIGPGVFYCQWWGPTDECIVDPVVPCAPGFVSEPEKCAALTIDDCDGSYFDCVSAYEEECYECDPDYFICNPIDPAKYGGDCPYTDITKCWEDCVAPPGEAKYRCYEGRGCLKADDGEFDSWGECVDNCDFYGKATLFNQKSAVYR